MPPSFRDRRDAGLQLGTALLRFRADEPIVLGIARGGAEVGAMVAKSLGAPFDIVVVRKIAPSKDREFGVGAIEPDGSRYLDPDALAHRNVGENLNRLSEEAEKEVARRLADYRGNRSEPDLNGRTVILVDDGLASGVSASAAALYVRRRGAKRIVLAVPIAAPSALEKIEGADEIFAILTPADFRAVADAYEDLKEATDDDVRQSFDLASSS